jgi:hypothetical protein
MQIKQNTFWNSLERSCNSFLTDMSSKVVAKLLYIINIGVVLVFIVHLITFCYLCA